MSEQTLFSCCWHSRPENVQRARQTARHVIEPYAAEQIDLLELAIGEACANAVEHGSPADGDSRFVLRCRLRIKVPALVFEVEDEGGPAPAGAMSVPHAPDTLFEGGRGLFLIQQIMDDVFVERTARGLILRMSKRVHLSPVRLSQLIAHPAQAG